MLAFAERGQGMFTFGFLTIIVFANVIATIKLWRETARRRRKPKSKFMNALLHGEPITPKHLPPKAIGESFPSRVNDEDKLFFDEFADFADAVNDLLAGSPWRLQELPDTELKCARFSDGPTFGRRYAIFHNQVSSGTLEISADFPFYISEKKVRMHIKLNWILLFAFDAVDDFLASVAAHVCYSGVNTKEYFETNLAIHRALLGLLWETEQVPELEIADGYWGGLELRLGGSASWYFVRREALRKRLAAN
jgi:hypothetical protein